ncbi:MAG: hypothetical protein R3B54_06120 [Bdellovibrionota bacterium]
MHYRMLVLVCAVLGSFSLSNAAASEPDVCKTVEKAMELRWHTEIPANLNPGSKLDFQGAIHVLEGDELKKLKLVVVTLSYEHLLAPQFDGRPKAYSTEPGSLLVVLNGKVNEKVEFDETQSILSTAIGNYRPQATAQVNSDTGLYFCKLDSFAKAMPSFFVENSAEKADIVPPIVTLAQFDKVIYAPGEKIQMRLLIDDKNPLSEEEGVVHHVSFAQVGSKNTIDDYQKLTPVKVGLGYNTVVEISKDTEPGEYYLENVNLTDSAGNSSFSLPKTLLGQFRIRVSK